MEKAMKAQKDQSPEWEEAAYDDGFSAGLASCAAGPWEYPPVEPPHCKLLVESENYFYVAVWNKQFKQWEYTNEEYKEIVNLKTWKRWARINPPEEKP